MEMELIQCFQMAKSGSSLVNDSSFQRPFLYFVWMKYRHWNEKKGSQIDLKYKHRGSFAYSIRVN